MLVQTGLCIKLIRHFSHDIARITHRDFDPNIKFDYPGLFDGMRFNISDREFLYAIDKDGFSGPEDLTSLQTYRFEISNFVKTILSPSYTGPFDVNTTGRSRPELFQRMFNENSSTNIARLRSFYSLVYNQYRNISNSRALNGLLSESSTILIKGKKNVGASGCSIVIILAKEIGTIEL